MSYEFLPLPQRDLNSGNPINLTGSDVELEKLKNRRETLSANDLIPVIRSLSEENQNLQQIINGLQLNVDTVANKFPVQGQDQNMQRSWTGLAYAANWADYSAAWAAGYRRTSEGLVYIRGVAKTAAGYAYGGAGSIITTLPVGFRPTTVTHAFPAMTYDAGYGYYIASIVYIDTAGNVQIVAGLQSPGGGGSGAVNNYLWLYTSFWVY